MAEVFAVGAIYILFFGLVSVGAYLLAFAYELARWFYKQQKKKHFLKCGNTRRKYFKEFETEKSVTNQPYRIIA